MVAAPRIALQPADLRSFLIAAIEDGGGVVVEPEDAEGMIWADPHDPRGLSRLLERHPAIKWVQLPWAGVEPMAEVIDSDRVWTCGKGVYAEEVAEHALGLALAGLRHIGAYARAGRWTEPAGVSLLGAHVTILGAGGLATSLIRLLEPFHCEVSVLRRQPEAVPGAVFTGSLDDLSSVLPHTDLLVLALALTPETIGVIDSRALRSLPVHAWIVNVARGQHVVTEDLVDVLREGRIGGAALDVTDPEPLPDDHPLWSQPNCIITPHTANTPEMAVPVLSQRVSENVRRFGRGHQLLGIVDVDAGF